MSTAHSPEGNAVLRLDEAPAMQRSPGCCSMPGSSRATPESTLCRSRTSSEGNGCASLHTQRPPDASAAPPQPSVGKSCVHVSSPSTAARRPCAARQKSRLSSSSAAAPKDAPASTNVGRLPVSRPFSRCCVVVGGSARKGASSEPVRSARRRSEGSDSCRSARLCAVPLATSQRRPSTTSSTARAKGASRVQQAGCLGEREAGGKLLQVLLCGSSTRVSRKPRAKRARARAF